MWHIGRAARSHPEMSTAADDDDFELPQRRRTRVQTHDGDDADAEDEAAAQNSLALRHAMEAQQVGGSCWTRLYEVVHRLNSHTALV